MRRKKLVPFAFALAFMVADFNPVFAMPVEPQMLNASTASGAIDLIRFGGRGGGHRGYAGHHRGYVAHRGYGFRGGGMYRGHVARRTVARRTVAGRTVARRAVIGRRYYGGIWYGARRRYWAGRWWAYGVGSCWRYSPIGYVWVCQ